MKSLFNRVCEGKMKITNVVKHFKIVTIHRWYVFLNCCKAGMPIRGLCHDLSKYSKTEFNESVKYFQGNRSPIDACKEEKGYSMAWMHHKGRNPHHYEYWQDNFDKGGQPIQMRLDGNSECLTKAVAKHIYKVAERNVNNKQKGN